MPNKRFETDQKIAASFVWLLKRGVRHQEATFMTIRSLFVLPAMLMSAGCVTSEHESINDGIRRLMALDGSVYFDRAEPYFTGRLQKMKYLGTDKQIDAQESDEGVKVLAECIRVETAGHNLYSLPDALIVSKVFSCLNRFGWTIEYEDLIID